METWTTFVLQSNFLAIERVQIVYPSLEWTAQMFTPFNSKHLWTVQNTLLRLRTSQLWLFVQELFELPGLKFPTVRNASNFRFTTNFFESRSHTNLLFFSKCKTAFTFWRFFSLREIFPIDIGKIKYPRWFQENPHNLSVSKTPPNSEEIRTSVYSVILLILDDGKISSILPNSTEH